MSKISRRSLVASAATLPALAVPAVTASTAVAVATPTISPDTQPHIDSLQAIAARAEQLVDVLATRYVREGWAFDHDRAARFLQYVRHLDATVGNTDREGETIKWVLDHGQSPDWLFYGDVSDLITGQAATRATIGTPVDAELIALGDELQRLWPEYLAARDAFNEEVPDDGPAATKYDAIDWQTCKLAEQIMVIPAHTMAGLRVKAMVAIYSTEVAESGNFWSTAFNDLSWDHQGMRALIEAACNVTGIDVAEHLGRAVQS